MMKQILFLFALSFILFSCGNNSKKNDIAAEAENEALKITVAELLNAPDDYVGQKIIVSGIVDHVCKNGGKKMFILGENPENRLKITTGQEISVFEIDLEGNDVTVEGIFTELRIDEDYLAKIENEEHAEHDESAVNTHEGEDTDDGDHVEGSDQITDLRNKIEESGKGYISQYSVECVKYPEKVK